MENTFEKFLEAKFVEENPQVLDDDLPDEFDDWLAEQEMADMLDYGEEAMKSLRAEFLEEIRNTSNEPGALRTLFYKIAGQDQNINWRDNDETAEDITRKDNQ